MVRKSHFLVTWIVEKHFRKALLFIHLDTISFKNLLLGVEHVCDHSYSPLLITIRVLEAIHIAQNCQI